MSGAKGSAKERELKDLFLEAGWFCRRAGGSGAGSNASYDLIAAKDGVIILIELKYRDAGADVYFDYEELFGDPEMEEVNGLTDVADYFDYDGNVHVYAAVRWKRDTTFYGFIPETLKRAGKDDDGNPKVEPEHKEWAIELPPNGDDLNQLDVEQLDVRSPQAERYFQR